MGLRHGLTIPLKHGSLEIGREIKEDRILCNDIILPGEYNPHKVRPWLISAAFSNWPTYLGVVWAPNEQDALDTVVNEGLGDALIVNEVGLSEMDEDEREELTSLGGAGELCDLSSVGCEPLDIDPCRDWALLCAFAEARGAGAATLDDLR